MATLLNYLSLQVNIHICFTETLRKYPFGPFLNRHCDEDYLIEETGLVIEKGVSVIVPIWGIHHDPKYFPNPDEFDPERFNDENKQNIVPCSYLPFGEGPRNCIGKKLFEILILTRFLFIFLFIQVIVLHY